MNTTHSLLIILVSAVATFATRALPFLLFPAGKPTPKYILYLGKVLPCTTIGMLVVYCLKDIAPAEWPYGLPELLAVVLVAAVQFLGRNTLISIVSGTVLYMVLVQGVF